jgi:hypothetical protein
MIYYQNNERLLVAVDCIIFGFDDEPDQIAGLRAAASTVLRALVPDWILCTGQLKVCGQAAVRVVKEIHWIWRTFSSKRRARTAIPAGILGARVISIAHYALIRLDEYQQNAIGKISLRGGLALKICRHLVFLITGTWSEDALDKAAPESPLPPDRLRIAPRKIHDSLS